MLKEQGKSPAIATPGCVLHGSLRKHMDLFKDAHTTLTQVGFSVLAPTITDVAAEENGFVKFKGEEDVDARLIEARFLKNIPRLQGKNSFSYFINPEGIIGKSAIYELGIAQARNVRRFFMETPDDPPIYAPKNTVIGYEKLAKFYQDTGTLPEPAIRPDEQLIQDTLDELVKTNLATGGIIEYSPGGKQSKQILLVRTHQWNNRYSVVGERVRLNEGLEETLHRGIMEETGLAIDTATHLCTFEQYKNSGYYKPGIQLIFSDFIARVSNKKVTLNDEAQGYLWIPAEEALQTLNIEPNTRHAIEIYTAQPTN